MPRTNKRRLSSVRALALDEQPGVIDTQDLAARVFEAVELVLGAFESAPDDQLHQLHQSVASVVLRLIFLLYAEDRGLLPSELGSVQGLYDELVEHVGVHESIGARFGAHDRLRARFRSLFVARAGRLFDPASDPFLAATIDDGVVHAVLERIVIVGGRRVDYRDLEIEQLGSVYESLIGYHVLRVRSPAVRLGKHRTWIETASLRACEPAERKKWLKDVCGLSSAQHDAVEAALAEHGEDGALADALSAGKKGLARERDRVAAGRLVLQPDEGRRRSGSHYTPRALTERVVRRTLAPILACLGPEPSDAQILALGICDPTMGSGAFLVEACRQLAEPIVAAWTRAGALSSIAASHGDPHAYARRLVAQRCLYGVDKNEVAVELAKLSLWLLTKTPALPFGFVDHALRHGDSLIGLNLRQIAGFHWHEARPLPSLAALVDARFEDGALERIRLIADVCVGAFFAAAKDKPRERELARRRELVERWLAGEDELEPELRAMARVIREQHAPFHWWLEFPGVFAEARPDPLDGDRITGAVHMQAIVGNPPFLAGRQVSTTLGDEYLAWLLATHAKSHGNADLSAHFFRRCDALLGTHGAIGLIATNTIGEGDTRSTGLQYLLCERGYRIHDAIRSVPWPVAGAAVTVSVVHLARGNPAMTSPLMTIHSLDPRDSSQMITRQTATIDSRLRPAPERQDARRLGSNAGLNFLGSKIYGQGFLLSPSERAELIARDPRNAECIFPYVVGEDINTSPDHGFDRYVINFGDVELGKAGEWPDLLAIVEARVRPERERLKDNADGVRLKQYWWRFFRHVAPLYAAMKRLDRVLVISRVSKHLCLCFQATDRVFSEAANVFPLADWTAFAVLQSRVHEPWARRLSSSMKTDLRYAASDCFDTFPFPRPDSRAVLPEVELAGRAFYEARARFMLATNQGLTKTYNALTDPTNTDAAVHALRRLTEAMDRAVLDAYGWVDLEAPRFCPQSAAEREAHASFEDEVIDRLYLLNAERADEEQRLGLPRDPHPRSCARAT